jgi:ABC-type multidrug transport system permease subunit
MSSFFKEMEDVPRYVFGGATIMITLAFIIYMISSIINRSKSNIKNSPENSVAAYISYTGMIIYLSMIAVLFFVPDKTFK